MEHIKIILLLLLFKKVGSARLRESDVHPISPKTPAPQYQPRQKEEKVKKSKRVRIEHLGPIKKHRPALETRQSHNIEYGVSKIVP